MPCYYTGSAEGDRQLAFDEAKKKSNSTITKLTQILCEVGEWADDQDFFEIENMPASFLKFWSNHKKTDKDRAQKAFDECVKKHGIEKTVERLTNG